jgi:hypothetical protein
VEVEAVVPAVERHPRFVEASLGRHLRDGVGRNVGSVGEKEVKATAQGCRQRLEQVAFVHVPAGMSDIAPGAAHRRGLDVDSVELYPVHGGSQCHPYGPGAATHVDGDAGPSKQGASQPDGLADHELGTAAGDEDPRPHEYAKTAELSPTHQVLKGYPGRSRLNHGRQTRRCRGLRQEEESLFLGEDTTGIAEFGGDGRQSPRRWAWPPGLR